MWQRRDRRVALVLRRLLQVWAKVAADPRMAIKSGGDGLAALPYAARNSRIACQIRALVVGMSRCLTPSGASASITALTIAGKAPTVPASPAPFAPSGLSLVGHGLLSILMVPRSSARGIA